MLHTKSPQNINSAEDIDDVLPSAPGGTLSVQILNRLLSNNSTYVTYDQIEDELLRAGLDPFNSSELYEWLIEQLEQTSVKVVDNVSTDNTPTLDQLVADTAELRDLYYEISRASDDFPPLLTASEERRLLEIVSAGQCTWQIEGLSEEQRNQLEFRAGIAKQARDELVRRNQRLVYYIAKQFIHRSKHLELEDLVQEGNLGLMTAIEKFDLHMGEKFSTYAVWWIRQAISRAVADKDRMIRIPVHRVEEIMRLRRAELQLEQGLGRTPTDLELAQALELLRPETVKYLADSRNIIGPQPAEICEELTRVLRHVRRLRQVLSMDPISYDIQVKEGDDASTLADFIPDTSVCSIEDKVALKLLKGHLDEVLNDLKPRERDVLNMRFGLEDGVMMTLEEVGRIYEVTRERVRQIESKALQKLRHPRRSRKLRDYLS